MKNSKNSKYKILHTEYESTKEIKNYILSLSQLAKLNVLLSKNLISKNEYEKVKREIGFITKF